MLSLEFDGDDKLTSFESIPLIYLRMFIRVHLYLLFIHRGLFQRRERNKRERSGLFLFSYLLVPNCQGVHIHTVPHVQPWFSIWMGGNKNRGCSVM